MLIILGSHYVLLRPLNNKRSLQWPSLVDLFEILFISLQSMSLDQSWRISHLLEASCRSDWTCYSVCNLGNWSIIIVVSLPCPVQYWLYLIDNTLTQLSMVETKKIFKEVPHESSEQISMELSILFFIVFYHWLE